MIPRRYYNVLFSNGIIKRDHLTTQQVSNIIIPTGFLRALVFNSIESVNLSIFHTPFDASAQEFFLRIANFASIYSESILRPFVEERVFLLYKLLRDGRIAIQLDLIFDRASLDISFRVSMDDFTNQLFGACSRWIEPVDRVLPSKVMSTRHPNQRLIDSLLRELVQDSLERSNELLKGIRLVLMPIIHSAATVPVISNDPKVYIEACQDSLDSLRKLIHVSSSRLISQTKGLFKISCESILIDIHAWGSETRKALVNSVLCTLKQKVRWIDVGIYVGRRCRELLSSACPQYL